MSARSRLRGLITAAILALAAMPMIDAEAATASYYLDQSDISSMPDGTNYLEVTLTSNSAGSVDFSISPVFGFSEGANFGLQSFGFNYAGSNTLSASNFVLPTSWSASFMHPTQMSGFGKFGFAIQGTGSSRLSPLTFSLTGLGGATADETLSYFAQYSGGNDSLGNQYFAAHLAGFVSGTDTSAYFGGSTFAPAVPEADTFIMMTAGLGMLGAMIRRKKKSKV